VRDVVKLHLLAMTHPAAKGERFLAVAGDAMSIVEVARLLKSRVGESARKVSTRQLPDWVVRLVALRMREAKGLLPELGNVRNASSEKAKRMLGWSPRSREEAILATAESLVRLGLLKDGSKRG